MGTDGQTADTVTQALKDAVIRGLTEMPLEKFSKMCEIKEYNEDPSGKLLRVDSLKRALGLDKLRDLEDYFAK